MTMTVAERRRHERRIFVRSMIAAVLLHVLAVAYWTGTRADPRSRQPGISIDPDELSEGEGTQVALFFGPPNVYLPDGSLAREDPSRTLSVDRILVSLSSECAHRIGNYSAPVRGRARLRLDDRGHPEDVRLERGTGDVCGDQIVVRVANDLLYLWLPNERFPAPVDLIQPVTVSRPQD